MYNVQEKMNLIYDTSHPDVCLLDLYLPETSHPCPVLIYFHAGSLEFGSRKGRVSKVLRNMVQNHGIAIATADYRMYPDAHYPDFIEDAAQAVNWVKAYGDQNHCFSEYFICGSSAGGYLAMMLFFNRAYLLKHRLTPDQFSGFIFDAGQPTTHFNVLREYGIDTRAIRCDETAPLYYVDHEYKTPETQPRILILLAGNELKNRTEQNHLLYSTMEHLGYNMDRIGMITLEGFEHCEYFRAKDANDHDLWGEILSRFILNIGDWKKRYDEN